MNSHSVPQQASPVRRALTGGLTTREMQEMADLSDLLYWAGATRRMRVYCWNIYCKCGFDAAKALAERWAE